MDRSCYTGTKRFSLGLEHNADFFQGEGKGAWTKTEIFLFKNLFHWGGLPNKLT